MHHAQSRPLPPSEVSELPVPQVLESLLMTCLEKSPGRRVASALELEARLARVPVARPWTQQDAREWWEAHAPDVLAGTREPPDVLPRAPGEPGPPIAG